MAIIPANINSPKQNFMGPEQDDRQSERFPSKSYFEGSYPWVNVCQTEQGQIIHDNTPGRNFHRTCDTSGNLHESSYHGMREQMTTDHSVEYKKGGHTETTDHNSDVQNNGHCRINNKGDCHTETAGDHSHAVGRHSSESVGGNKAVSAKGGMALASKGDLSLHSGGSIVMKSDSGTHSKVKGDFNMECTGSITLTADKGITLNAKGGDVKVQSSQLVRTHGDQGTNVEGKDNSLPPTHFTPGPKIV